MGLVVRAANVREFAEHLDGVVARAAHSFTGIDADVELHGHDLFGATQDWASLKPLVRARISIYRQALDVTAKHAEGIWVEGLDRKGFRDRYADQHDEHITVLLHLLEKLNRYANRHGEDLVVIADEHRTAKSAQAALRTARRERIWGYRGKPQRIADTVYSSLQQAAASFKRLTSSLFSISGWRMASTATSARPLRTKASGPLWRMSRCTTGSGSRRRTTAPDCAGAEGRALRISPSCALSL
ncbi:hypothetical protein GCM10027063_11900 [Promicromonospora xylanilytica]